MNPIRVAAELGNIDLLYEAIGVDSSILEIIDSNQFVETPLHIAATKGHLPFTIEVMNLKPSFAWKLNPQGFSPIHLAMQNSHKEMVFCFADMNKDLIRLKGREGMTPLHFACQIEEVDILAEFLTACPDSIQDVTVRGETALHIAVKNNNYNALHLLVCFLRKNTKRGARKLEYKILNQKDGDGNTILHISAQRNQQQALQLLVKSGVNLKAKNLQSRTALDVAANVPTITITNILLSAGAKPGKEPATNAPTVANKLKTNTTIIDKVIIYVRRFRSDISEEQRNTWLIIATLVATATYQSVLSPPGGFQQANADKNLNTTSSNSTISTLGKAGKSILSESDFAVFSHLNVFSFMVSIMAILIMAPWGEVGTLVFGPVVWFAVSYLYSMWMISFTPFNSIIAIIFLSLFGFYPLLHFILHFTGSAMLRKLN